jgi:hypothetical protein
MRFRFNEWMIGTLVLVIYLIVTALTGRSVGRVELLFGVSVALLLVIFMKLVAWGSFRGR